MDSQGQKCRMGVLGPTTGGATPGDGSNACFARLGALDRIVADRGTERELSDRCRLPKSRSWCGWILIGLLVDIVLLHSMVYAQWTTYTIADGLANNDVRSVIQSSDGAMWFGTEKGVSRYDGTTWQTFTTADGLAGPGVSSMFQSSDGAI